MRPATLRPAALLGAEKPHGQRMRYMAGCRCVPCRAANSRYECLRARRRAQGLWNGLVRANRARHHLLRLSRMNVGYKTVAARTGISCSVLWKIRSGSRRQIRALNERLILSISSRDVRGSALVDARPTWRMIGELVQEGFSKARIARELGRKTPALQLRDDFITADNARAVLDLYRRYQ